MLLLPLLVSVVLSAEPNVSDVACQTVADCWLDVNGKAMARPASKRGHPLPRGDCGNNLLWLRNRLSCEEHVCKAEHVGDRC